MSRKRKHKILAVKDKIDILKKLDTGETVQIGKRIRSWALYFTRKKKTKDSRPREDDGS